MGAFLNYGEKGVQSLHVKGGESRENKRCAMTLPDWSTEGKNTCGAISPTEWKKEEQNLSEAGELEGERRAQEINRKRKCSACFYFLTKGICQGGIKA